MRFLALATSDDAWFAALSADDSERLSAAEARRSRELHEAGLIRGMSWRTDRRDVVIEVEAGDLEAAEAALATLPFVEAGALSFEVIGLRPYDGWSRLADADARIVERAIAWALERVGSRDYVLRCLSFVEDAYEVPNGIEIFGGSSARESAERYGVTSARDDPPGDDPTRGAFVFFATSGPVDGVPRDWGHVGLAIGDGRMVHAWPEVRIDLIADVPSLPSGEWSPPIPVGWAPPSRILTGSRPITRRA